MKFTNQVLPIVVTMASASSSFQKVMMIGLDGFGSYYMKNVTGMMYHVGTGLYFHRPVAEYFETSW